jgi:hypothetical protein
MTDRTAAALASALPVTTTGLTAHPARPAAGYPIVQGRCPACGAASLFLASGGFVTCASLRCPNPTQASYLLHALDPMTGPHTAEEKALIALLALIHDHVELRDED